MKASDETYKAISKAFNIYNEKLFNLELPTCMFVFQKMKGSKGYYAVDRWEKSNFNEMKLDEIALNPDTSIRPLVEVLSTLVHEMCHLWRVRCCEKKPRNYHCKEWANKMRHIGLIPSNTGMPGGKETGVKMTHYIDEEGKFLQVTKDMIEKGFKIPWLPVVMNETIVKKKRESKTKYTCPECGLNVWGKKGIYVQCYECKEMLLSEE